MTTTLAPPLLPADAKVADAVAATLHAHGVRFAFGIPGNDVLELLRACESAGIRFVIAKSEPSAAFMADAVAHVTGAPAACIFALGPGVANGVSGVAGALMERSPVVVLGGEMAANRRQIYNHQVFDHVAALTPVTKYAAELNAERASQQVARALDIATAAPRGPVFLNCPADATRAPAKSREVHGPARVLPAALDAESAARIRSRLAAARRPLALVGLGALGGTTAPATAAFLEAWRMPFLASYKVKGLLPESHAMCMGAVALSPVVDEISLKLVGEADLIVLVGFDPIELRDAWLDAWPADKTVVSVDAALPTHRIFPVGENAIGDVATILGQLAPERSAVSAWSTSTLGAHRQAVAQVVRPREPGGAISPAALFHAVSRRVSDRMRMTVDVGAHRILANHVIQCVTPGQLLQSNGLGCMGYAIPAAIGAALADPKRGVVAMLGDGCALMSLGELALVAELELPIVTVVLNDASLALIELKQSKMGMARHGVTFRSPGFAEIAKGFSIPAERVSDPASLEAALDRALATKRPALVEAMVDHSEYWEQM